MGQEDDSERRMPPYFFFSSLRMQSPIASRGSSTRRHKKPWGSAKVDIGIGNQADEPRQNGTYRSFQIHRVSPFRLFSNGCAGKGVAGEIALLRLRAVAQGVHQNAVFHHLKMEMRAGGVARGAGDADGLALLDVQFPR